jgi:hypothetical protein
MDVFMSYVVKHPRRGAALCAGSSHFIETFVFTHGASTATEPHQADVTHDYFGNTEDYLGARKRSTLPNPSAFADILLIPEPFTLIGPPSDHGKHLYRRIAEFRFHGSGVLRKRKDAQPKR